jgi:hypothetical protein
VAALGPDLATALSGRESAREWEWEWAQAKAPGSAWASVKASALVRGSVSAQVEDPGPARGRLTVPFE